MKMSPGRCPSQGTFPLRVRSTPTSSISPPNRINVLPSSATVTLSLEQFALTATARSGNAEMPIRLQRRHPPAGSTLEKPFLEQIGFVYVLDGTFFFADGGGDGFDTDRPAIKFLDDREQNGAIHLVEAGLIHLQKRQGRTRDLARHYRDSFDLGKVAHSP